MKTQKITLVCRGASTPDRDWNLSNRFTSRIILTEQLNVLRYAISETARETGVDIERVILDHSGSADNFLQVVAGLPHFFTGDALFLKDDGSGFMSSAGNGGDRVLYQLTAQDIRFYLETAGLVTGSMTSPYVPQQPGAERFRAA